jgi:hypothetical protein
MTGRRCRIEVRASGRSLIGPGSGAIPGECPGRVQWFDGLEYGRWRRALRQHGHGLTVISRYAAPSGKAWKIVGKASEPGEEACILEGCYHDAKGRVIAGPGNYMFNAPGASGVEDYAGCYESLEIVAWLTL